MASLPPPLFFSLCSRPVKVPVQLTSPRELKSESDDVFSTPASSSPVPPPLTTSIRPRVTAATRLPSCAPPLPSPTSSRTTRTSIRGSSGKTAMNTGRSNSSSSSCCNGITVPLERYRAKLVECAALHRSVADLTSQRETYERFLAAEKAENVRLRTLVAQLQSASAAARTTESSEDASTHLHEGAKKSLPSSPNTQTKLHDSSSMHPAVVVGKPRTASSPVGSSIAPCGSEAAPPPSTAQRANDTSIQTSQQQEQQRQQAFQRARSSSSSSSSAMSGSPSRSVDTSGSENAEAHSTSSCPSTRQRCAARVSAADATAFVWAMGEVLASPLGPWEDSEVEPM